MDKIYIIGHQTPDLDSVVAGIAYANLKNKLENTDKYLPARTGETNPLTDFILEKYSFAKPAVLNDEAAQVILVDHNEAGQRFSAADSVKIIEILDHHKLNFAYPDPIEFNRIRISKV